MNPFLVGEAQARRNHAIKEESLRALRGLANCVSSWQEMQKIHRRSFNLPMDPGDIPRRFWNLVWATAPLVGGRLLPNSDGTWMNGYPECREALRALRILQEAGLILAPPPPPTSG